MDEDEIEITQAADTVPSDVNDKDIAFGHFKYADGAEETDTDSTSVLVDRMIPDGDDWSAKTIFASRDEVIAHSLARSYFDRYPEVAHLEPQVLNFVHNKEKLQTSLAGIGRDQIIDLGKSVGGGGDAGMKDHVLTAWEFLQESMPYNQSYDK